MKLASKKRKVEFYNRKARFDYQILESFESGIVLNGNEIKAIRAGKISMKTSYAKIINQEIFWIGGNIAASDGDPQRTRKLLVHRSEIDRLIGKTKEDGLALIPLKLYLKRGRAKLEIGICKGLKKYDQRRKIKEKELNREISRTIKTVR